MSNRYVRKTGSDSNGGTSASDAWATIGKALGASGIASGDILYIGAGTYREAVTVNMTSATAETRIVADSDGVLTGDQGEVIWSAWTTNDTTTNAAACCALNGRDFLTFEGITFMGGAQDGSTINGATGSTDLTFKKCTFIGGGVYQNVRISIAATAAVNYLFECCIFFGAGNALDLESTNPVSDYDANITIRNCFFHWVSTAILVNLGGGNSGRMGGVRAYNCTSMNSGNFMSVPNSATFPDYAMNNVIFGGNAALSTNTSGGLVEDYNLLITSVPRSNVTAGTHSKAGQAAQVALGMEVGQAVLRGANPRFFGMPTAGSPLLGFGNDGTLNTAIDLLARTRPEGGASTTAGIGALERHETGAQDTAQVHSGTNSLALTGPASHRFELPVDTTVTSVKVWVRYDTNHGTTNKPQAKIVNSTECGVSNTTATATVGVDTWEELTLSISPTKNGVATLELVSRSAAGSGIAWFDDVTVA